MADELEAGSSSRFIDPPIEEEQYDVVDEIHHHNVPAHSQSKSKKEGAHKGRRGTMLGGEHGGHGARRMSRLDASHTMPQGGHAGARKMSMWGSHRTSLRHERHVPPELVEYENTYRTGPEQHEKFKVRDP